jgi:hypothetical protein
MALLDVFIGVPQSKYAAIAVLTALIVVAVAILFGKETVPMGQKFVSILLMFLVAFPGLLLALFQLTCLVTGTGGNKWWCGVYAWIGTVLMFLYAVIIVVVAVMSMSKGTDVITDLSSMEQFQAEMEQANTEARKYFAAGEQPSAPMPPAPGVHGPAAPPTTSVVRGAAPSAPGADATIRKTGAAPFEDSPRKQPSYPTEAPVQDQPPLPPMAGAGPVPSEPETFTTCGAPYRA